MKKVKLLITLLLLTSIFSLAQSTPTVSGTITDMSNIPITNHQVEILAIGDSLTNPGFYFYQLVQTDTNGYYSVVIPNYVNGIIISVFTDDCQGITQSLLGWSAPFVADFSLCTATSCIASFYFVPDSFPTGTFYFIDTSTGSPTAWMWDFGDGTTSTLQNPTHTYAQPGTYVVTLTITGPNCSDTQSMTITFGSQSCVADFAYYPDSTSNMFYFIDLSTGSPTAWMWDFGDGTTSTLQNPTHTYAQPGTYVVTLTITGPNCFDTMSMTIITGNPSCNAAFSYSVDPNSSLIYQFQDLSTGAPTSWSWDFGDGSTSAFQNPSHTYAQAGNYTVILSILGPNCSDSYSTLITVTAPVVLDANFSFTIDQANPLLVHFTDLSTGNPVAWHWSFGDSNTSTNQNPSHLYSNALSYTVTLTISGTTGTDSYTQNVDVTQTINVETIDKPYELKLYPVPAMNELYIDFGETDFAGQVHIITSDGKKVFSKDIHSISINNLDISDLSAGQYFMRFINDDEVFYKKLIVQ